MISVVPPKIGWTRLSRQSSQPRRRPAGQCWRRPRPGSIWSARAAAVARCDLGGDHAPGDCLAAAWPRRARRTCGRGYPSRRCGRRRRSSSSRHGCRRSSRCTIPATTARCGRALASRRGDQDPGRSSQRRLLPVGAPGQDRAGRRRARPALNQKQMSPRMRVPARVSRRSPGGACRGRTARPGGQKGCCQGRWAPFPRPGACTGGSRLWFPNLQLASEKGHLAA